MTKISTLTSVLACLVALSGCRASNPEVATRTTLDASSGLADVAAPDPRTHDISGFGLWSGEELSRRNDSLATRIGADASARETLDDYGNHRFRFIRREGDGFPEQHDEIIDVVIVQSGQAVLQLGGTLVDPESGSPGEWRGSSLDGGERHTLRTGDVVHIPATVPHAFLVPEGEHFTYVLVKFPAP